MQIYADIVFVINFVMDMFILWIVSKLVKQNLGKLRLCLASLTMSLLYCLLIFQVSLQAYMNVFAALLIIMLGILISFKPKGVIEFLKLTFLAHISAFAVGGLGMAMFYFTNIGDIMGNMLGFTVHNFSFKLLLISTCCFYIFIKFFLAYMQKSIRKNQILYPVRICLQDKDVNLTALMDTGNSLHDPISNSPVIVAEFEAVKNCLPDSFKLLFYEKRDNDLDSLAANFASHYDSGLKIRMIPFASLGKKHGMLLGFKPDKVEIADGSSINTIDNVIIGIYNFDLSKNGSYQGLLSPELIHK